MVCATAWLALRVACGQPKLRFVEPCEGSHPPCTELQVIKKPEREFRLFYEMMAVRE